MKPISKLPAVSFRRINLKASYKFRNTPGPGKYMPDWRLRLLRIISRIAKVRLINGSEDHIKFKQPRMVDRTKHWSLPGDMQETISWQAQSLRQQLRDTWQKEHETVQKEILKTWNKTNHGDTTQ